MDGEVSLTSYQQAVLQEIGIPTWITKEAYNEKVKEGTARTNNQLYSSPAAQVVGANEVPVTSTPISKEEKQSRLAQLRASVSGSVGDNNNEKGKTEKSTASLPETKAPNKRESASMSSPLPVSPDGIPLSAEQKAKSQQWLKDLQLACIQLGVPSNWASTIMIGRTLSISDTAIILPATPLKLTVQQKRELWSQLVSVGAALNNSNSEQQ